MADGGGDDDVIHLASFNVHRSQGKRCVAVPTRNYDASHALTRFKSGQVSAQPLPFQRLTSKTLPLPYPKIKCGVVPNCTLDTVLILVVSPRLLGLRWMDPPDIIFVLFYSERTGVKRFGDICGKALLIFCPF